MVTALGRWRSTDIKYLYFKEGRALLMVTKHKSNSRENQLFINDNGLKTLRGHGNIPNSISFVWFWPWETCEIKSMRMERKEVSISKLKRNWYNHNTINPLKGKRKINASKLQIYYSI